MAQNKFVKPDTYDNFVTEKVDVIQNKLLGDYNANGVYVINKKIITELIEIQKTKAETYNNSMFLTGKTKVGKEISFQIDFKKNSASGLAAAELSVLESVPKQGGRLSNTIKTPIAKFTNKFTPDFIDKALTNFNVVINAEEGGKEIKELSEDYLIKRGMLLKALDKLTEENYNVIYEDYFTQRLNLLKQTNNAYSKKVLAIFNDEFNKVSDFFLIDKKSKKVTNYKAMNELLDKAFEDISGLDNYSEQERQYKERILPILSMFITSAERIEKSAQSDVLKTFPKKTKEELTDTLVDIKQAQESRLKPEVRESNPEVVTKEISQKLEQIKEKAMNGNTLRQSPSATQTAQRQTAMPKTETAMANDYVAEAESVIEDVRVRLNQKNFTSINSEGRGLENKNRLNGNSAEENRFYGLKHDSEFNGSVPGNVRERFINKLVTTGTTIYANKEVVGDKVTTTVETNNIYSTTKDAQQILKDASDNTKKYAQQILKSIR